MYECWFLAMNLEFYNMENRFLGALEIKILCNNLQEPWKVLFQTIDRASRFVFTKEVWWRGERPLPSWGKSFPTFKAQTTLLIARLLSSLLVWIPIMKIAPALGNSWSSIWRPRGSGIPISKQPSLEQEKERGLLLQWLCQSSSSRPTPGHFPQR